MSGEGIQVLQAGRTGAWTGTLATNRCLPPDCGLCCHKHCRDRVKEECKKPGAKGDVSPPGAPVPPTPISHASCGKTQGVAVLGRGLLDGDSSQGHEALPIIPTSLPPTGSEDSLSYTLSLEPETGCHLRHAWTQTEPPHPSWDPETVRRNYPLPQTGYRGDWPTCLRHPDRCGEAQESKNVL